MLCSTPEDATIHQNRKVFKSVNPNCFMGKQINATEAMLNDEEYKGWFIIEFIPSGEKLSEWRYSTGLRRLTWNTAYKYRFDASKIASQLKARGDKAIRIRKI